MKLWLITQNEVQGFDTFDAAVVAAETALDARRIHPKDGFTGDSLLVEKTWATSLKNVSCRWIGMARPGMGAGVILSSFNAG